MDLSKPNDGGEIAALKTRHTQTEKKSRPGAGWENEVPSTQQMLADEINQMGPNYMASHIYAAAATTNHHHHLHGRKQTSHHACISIKSVSIYIFFFFILPFDTFSNHSSLSLCFLYIRLIHRCQHGVATYNMPSTCLI